MDSAHLALLCNKNEEILRIFLQTVSFHGILNSALLYIKYRGETMLAARLGAWLRKTGERWAKAAFSEKLSLIHI